jgi:hypothetical protein
MLASMSTTAKVITFGIISGLIWSLIPGGLNELFSSVKESGLVLFAGILTGIGVSLVLKIPLARFSRWWTLIIGLISLPLGAFIFGIVFTLLDLVFGDLNGGDYKLFGAFSVGIEYALVSVISLFAVILFPLAVLTTFILRAIIHSGEKRAG